MRYKRNRYVRRLIESIKFNNRLILLTGPRDAGKTKILEYVYHSDELQTQKRYYSFDSSIVTKQFADVHELMHYMSIKLGVLWENPGVLMLNEIQYSNGILAFLQEIARQPHLKITIVATSVTDIRREEITIKSDQFELIRVYPLDFFEFLEDKGMHTAYLSLKKFSKVLIQEIQPYFDEYLIWGGYPAVVSAQTQDEKRQVLNKIVTKIFEKDAGFWFKKDQLVLFEEVISLLGHATAQGYKIKHIQKTLNVSLPTINTYLAFFASNHLFLPVAHFFSDKTKEISHQKMIYCIDTGMISFLNDAYSMKLKTPTSLANFVFQELLTNKRPGDQIMTYKKINMSTIDFVIVRADGTLIPITIGDKDTAFSSKITPSFLKMYGNRITHWIKLCPTLLAHHIHDTYTLHCIPRCMTKFLYEIIN